MQVCYIKMQAWQEEVERARQGQREAENKLSSLEVIYLFFKYFFVKCIGDNDFLSCKSRFGSYYSLHVWFHSFRLNCKK